MSLEKLQNILSYITGMSSSDIAPTLGKDACLNQTKPNQSGSLALAPTFLISSATPSTASISSLHRSLHYIEVSSPCMNLTLSVCWFPYQASGEISTVIAIRKVCFKPLKIFYTLFYTLLIHDKTVKKKIIFHIYVFNISSILEFLYYSLLEIARNYL